MNPSTLGVIILVLIVVLAETSPKIRKGQRGKKEDKPSFSQDHQS